jgi:hypothetical protein
MDMTPNTKPFSQNRKDTPERWRQALDRALLAGLEVRQLQGSGQWIVTSASDPGAAYETDGNECSCAAAMLGGDPVCMHRAVYRFISGRARCPSDDRQLALPAAA